MTNIKPSEEFPKDPFASSIANAVMSIICENIPALKGRNLAEDIVEHAAKRIEDNFGELSGASTFAADFMAGRSIDAAQETNLSSEAIDFFQNRLLVGISQEIIEQHERFNFLELYIRDEHETKPEWLGQIIEDVAVKTGFNLYSLMPYREKIAITIHSDGEIFWGKSGYGPADATTHLEDYFGKLENSVPFVDINQMQPDTTQAYVLDLGQYVPIIVPDDEPQEADTPNRFRVDSISRGIERCNQNIAYQERYLEDGQSHYNEATHESHLRKRDFLKSLQSMWDNQGFEGHPYPYVAFVPASEIQNLSKEELCDLDVLRRLRDADGTIMHVVQSCELPVTFESPQQYEWDCEVIIGYLSSGKHRFPFMDEELVNSLKERKSIKLAFRREGGHFRLITSPFYLSQISTPIQTGIGSKNIHLKQGDRLLFTTNEICPIGEYMAYDNTIYRFPEAASSYLRLVNTVDQPFNLGKDNMKHFFGTRFIASPPNLARLPDIRPRS